MPGKPSRPETYRSYGAAPDETPKEAHRKVGLFCFMLNPSERVSNLKNQPTRSGGLLPTQANYASPRDEPYIVTVLNLLAD